MLQLNVGHILEDSVGTTRGVSFDEARVTAEDVELSTLHGTLDLTRTAQGILVQGRLEASTHGECVRCLSAAAVDVGLDLAEHFVHPPTEAKEDEHSVSEGGIIDLTPVLREDAILAMPMHMLCQPDCRGLCSQCGQNLNEAECECDHSTIDPRLSTLKALLDE